MADNSGGNGGLYFIVGALVVVVAVMFVMLSGGSIPFIGEKHVDVKVEAPKLPGK
jgi:hypothetical protein